MKNIILALAVSCLTAPALHAQSDALGRCFASYKAKQADPLKLHFGVSEVESVHCYSKVAVELTVERIKADLTPRLAQDGWQLLTIEDILFEEELGEVQESAGNYFLRY